MARPRGFVEADVIAAAREQFWSHGYAGTSLDDLSVATGLGRGSLYGAFSDKHALFMRALDDYCSSVEAGNAAELRDTDERAYDRLVGHIRLMARRNAADTDRRGCLLAKTSAEMAATDKAVLQRVKRTMAAYQADLAATIVEAQRDGDIDPEGDADGLALLLLAVLRGAEALRKAGGTRASMLTLGEQAIAAIPRCTKAA
jgi:TetR/AcrR family transcriptional regulator, transcriptional repressor for nem operon